MNWIQRFLTAIATHKADASAHHAKTVSSDLEPGGSDPIRWGADKLLKGAGAGADQTEIDVPGYGRLNLKGFQFNPATGTMNNPERVNDDDTATHSDANQLGAYAEILLPAALHITQFRTYGHGDNDYDGTYKIQYMDVDGNWNDWVTGIQTWPASWTNWDSSGGDVVAIAIKILITLVDGSGSSRLSELEVIY